MTKFRHISSLFFLALFLSIKVSSLHLLVHEENENQINHCELCDIISSVNFKPLLSSEIDSTYPLILDFDGDKIKIETTQLLYHQNNLGYFFPIRPPPSIL